MSKATVILVGTGPMAIAYVDVLRALSVEPQVVGRGLDSAKKFQEATGIVPFTGGIAAFFENNSVSDSTYFIIATGTEALMPTLLSVIQNTPQAGILIEKPAAMSIEELLASREYFGSNAENIFVAYNRRFYSSVIEAQRMIASDGGLLSMQFEFTEWVHKIEPLTKAPGVKENWFFANSTHVVDLAFYLAGLPKQFISFVKTGGVKWHPITNFAGSGVTENGVLFTYLSNWESAGRWSIELLTVKRRIYLKPLEGLAVQQRGSVDVESVVLDDELDKKFKPGVFRQVNAFLSGDRSSLLSLPKHAIISDQIYSKILGNTEFSL